jgi:hypothetical protein
VASATRGGECDAEGAAARGDGCATGRVAGP